MFDLTPAWEVSGYIWEYTYKNSINTLKFHKFMYLIYYIIYPISILGFIVLCFYKRGNVIRDLVIGFFILHAYVSYGNMRFMAPMIPIMCLCIGFLGNAVVAGICSLIDIGETD